MEDRNSCPQMSRISADDKDPMFLTQSENRQERQERQVFIYYD